MTNKELSLEMELEAQLFREENPDNELETLPEDLV